MPDPEMAAGAMWCAVRVHGPHGAVDVALPTGLPVGEIIEQLRSTLLPGVPLGRPGETWYLHRLGRLAIHPASRLADAALHDGESLHLSRGSVPLPVQPVDDGLVALADGAAEVGRWSPRAVQILAAVALVAAATGAAVLALAVETAGPALPLLLAAALLAAAFWLRSGGSGGQDVPALAAALGSLPAWCAAGLASAALAGGGVAVGVTLAAGAVAVGAALAATCVPGRAPWWAFLGAASGTLSVGGALVAGGFLDVLATGAVLATGWLIAVALLPWVVTRSRGWLEPAAGGDGEGALVSRARQARRVVDAVALAGAGAVAVGAVVPALGGDGLAVGFAAVVGAVVGLRARRSRFVVESSAELAASFVVFAAVLAALARDGSPRLRLGLLVAVVLLVAVLGVVARDAAAGRVDSLAWWTRPRTRRTLDLLEGAAALAVLPLLADILGVYALAADLGARL